MSDIQNPLKLSMAELVVFELAERFGSDKFLKSFFLHEIIITKRTAVSNNSVRIVLDLRI